MFGVLEGSGKTLRGWGSRNGVDWAYATIELAGLPDRPSRFTGAVLIDGRQIGYLVDDRPREFRIAPGEHRIAVHLGREARVPGYPGPGVAFGRFTLGPGERIHLTCRSDGTAAEEWRRFCRLTGRRGQILLACMALAGLLAWVFAPILRPSVVDAVASLDLDRSLADLVRSPSRFRNALSFLSIGVCQLAGLLLLSRWKRKMTRRLPARSGNPYRMERTVAKVRSGARSFE